MKIEDAAKVDTSPANLDCLENPEIALNDLDEKECLSIAMSSYYLLYR